MSFNIQVLQKLDDYYLPLDGHLDSETKMSVRIAVEDWSTTRSCISDFFFRIGQAILSVFGCSSWQKAAKALTSFKIEKFKSAIRTGIKQQFDQASPMLLARAPQKAHQINELLNRILGSFHSVYDQFKPNSLFVDRAVSSELRTCLELNKRILSSTALQFDQTFDEVGASFELKERASDLTNHMKEIAEKIVARLQDTATKVTEEFVKELKNTGA